jgi:hypothetical protein
LPLADYNGRPIEQLCFRVHFMSTSAGAASTLVERSSLSEIEVKPRQSKRQFQLSVVAQWRRRAMSEPNHDARDHRIRQLRASTWRGYVIATAIGLFLAAFVIAIAYLRQ